MVEGARRGYVAPQRVRARLATRRQIRQAAMSLFLERGYGGTTMDLVAANAQVSARYIHMTFGGKADLFSEVIQIVIAGDDEPLPLGKRPHGMAMLDAGGAETLAAFAATSTAALQRNAGLLAVADVAAAADEDLAVLRDRGRRRRLVDCAEVVAALDRQQALKSELGITEAADVLYTLSAPATYQLFVDERSWSPDRYQQWLTDSTVSALLRPIA